MKRGSDSRWDSLKQSLLPGEQIRCLSLGVDVGSATTQFVFSSIRLVKRDLRFEVAGRDMAFASDVHLTPWSEHGGLDGARFQRLLASAYALSGLSRSDVDTGVLLLTGFALEPENARIVTDAVSEGMPSPPIALAAGDVLEARLAAFGSGALERSRGSEAVIANVDIGGGTTKVALCEGGQIVSTAAFNVGSRRLLFDERGRLSSIRQPFSDVAVELGLDLQLGAVPSHESLMRLAMVLVGRIFDSALGAGAQSDDRIPSLLRGSPLANASPVGQVLASGGVAEYVYGRCDKEYRDFGPYLGRAVLSVLSRRRMPLVAATSGVRATVLGASQYSIQLSGDTVYCSSTALLPLRSVPVVATVCPMNESDLDHGNIARLVRDGCRDVADSRVIALAVNWQGPASYSRLSSLAAGVATVLCNRDQETAVIVCDEDIAMVLAELIAECGYRRPLVAIDGISVGAFDFIDIDYPLVKSGGFPVIIKSLQYTGA